MVSYLARAKRPISCEGVVNPLFLAFEPWQVIANHFGIGQKNWKSETEAFFTNVSKERLNILDLLYSRSLKCLSLYSDTTGFVKETAAEIKQEPISPTSQQNKSLLVVNQQNLKSTTPSTATTNYPVLGPQSNSDSKTRPSKVKK